jgi:arabinogalactan oligomer/maltooligosaccharide transport system substrate-binding protein
MRKRVWILVMGILTLVTVVACNRKSGGTAAGTSANSLLVWTSPEIVGFMEQVAKDYEAEKNVTVTIVSIDSIEGDYKHTMDGPAGIGPDVLYGNHNDVGDKSAQGLFAKLNISREALDRVVPIAEDACSYEGNLYIMPDTMGTNLLIYNKDLVNAPPDTWDDLMAIINDPKFDNNGDGSLGILWNLGDIYNAAGVIFASGGYIFGNGNTNPAEIGLNNAGAIQGAEYVKELFGKMPRGMADRSSAGDLMLGLFTEGKVGMIVTGTGSIPQIEKAGINYGIARMPKLPNGKVIANYSGFTGMAVSGFSKKGELAWNFIEFTNQDKYTKDFFSMTGHIPVNKAFLNTYSASDLVINAFNDQIEYCVPMVKIPQGNQTWDPLHAAMGSLATGTDAKAAMDTAVTQIRDNIANMGK